ncbi:MAG TPA: dihydrolipoyl dehydrogenase [Chloroflexota bacterium]|nr:dihydrolipoyl dehydrogenase [Chloroflexota bacterium]
MAEQHFNLVFLGGGSGGYVGAIRAAQLGLSVAVIEKDKLGGTCLHRGCIPSKAYLESAHVYTQFQHRDAFGLTAENVGYDFGKINEYRKKVVDENWKGVQFLMRKNKITVIEGEGKISGQGQIAVQTADGQQRVTYDNLAIATGTRPRTLGIQVDGKRVFTSDNVWDAPEMPKSVIILGGGVIGAEFASFYNAFGVECTIVEMLGGLIPMMDEEVGKELQKLYTRRGIKVITGARAITDSVRSDDSGVTMDVEVNGERQTLQADQLLLAAAREGTTGGLGLETLGVELDRGFVTVGANNRTNVQNVFAVGDIAGGLGLAHKAYAEGILVAETIAGKNQLTAIDRNRIPQPVFSFPQVAAIGLTEKEARESGANVKTGKFPYTANARAKIVNEPVGFVKVVSDGDSGDVIGVHMIGPSVTEFIAEAALGKFLEATPWELAYNIHPHPTLSEALGEAAHAAEGEGALHI